MSRFIFENIFFRLITWQTYYSLLEATKVANTILNGPFCFVQTSDGKVVAVEYNPEEKTFVVNLKKGVAAAFQANFKKTASEIEEDTMSKHVSHFRSV